MFECSALHKKQILIYPYSLEGKFSTLLCAMDKDCLLTFTHSFTEGWEEGIEGEIDVGNG